MEWSRRRSEDPFLRTRLVSLCILAAALIIGGCASDSTSGDSALATPPPSSSPSPGGGADSVAPAIPQSVSASPVSSSEVQVSWAGATDNVGVTGYNVLRDGNRVAVVTSLSYRDSRLSPAMQYDYSVAAFDAAGNTSAQSTTVRVTTPAAGTSPNIYRGTPSNYLSLLRGLKPGDTLILESGDYDDPNDAPGLPIFDLNGEPGRPITITGPDSGPRPVLLGRSTHNTVRLKNASYVVIRNIEVDGRNLGGDGVNAQGVSHHITLENMVIRGVGSNQGVVGISTNGAPTWSWAIRNNEIIGAGTGMYLGNPNGINPFVAGLIEYNVIRDTIGYNIEIKHQDVRSTISGMPTSKNSSVIRHNVFSKSANSSTGFAARSNLLVGHFPPSGPGMDDVYEIYGNFFYQNPSEALFQGEGNIAFHHNLLVNDFGTALNIQPHNDVPKMVRVFHNTIVANGIGIRVTGGSTAYRQVVIGNAVFATIPIQAPDQQQNISDAYSNAGNYLTNPTAALGQLDLYPRVAVLKGPAIDTSTFSSFSDWSRDFNDVAQDETWRGAYSGEGTNLGWLPKLEIKPN